VPQDDLKTGELVKHACNDQPQRRDCGIGMPTPPTACEPDTKILVKLGMCLTQVAATLARGMAVLSWPGIRPTISS
jgi:hypothetical protein